MKVRFLCTKHECDLNNNDNEVMVQELLSDVDKTIPAWPLKAQGGTNEPTGYWLFTFDSFECSEGVDCGDTWKVVIYDK